MKLIPTYRLMLPSNSVLSIFSLKKRYTWSLLLFYTMFDYLVLCCFFLHLDLLFESIFLLSQVFTLDIPLIRVFWQSALCLSFCENTLEDILWFPILRWRWFFSVFYYSTVFWLYYCCWEVSCLNYYFFASDFSLFLWLLNSSFSWGYDFF